MSEPGNINSLYRTFCTKYTHYVPDGNGRDKYIIQNNGGMWIEAKRPVFTSNMYHKPPPSQMMPAPHKAATSFKYVSDGSGRDFYITFNSGGLEAPYVPGIKHPNAAFFESLRANKKIIKYKRHISPKEHELLKRSRSTQKVLIERLTANASKWKEMTQEHRRACSRRGSTSSWQRVQINRSWVGTRNAMNMHKTISTSGNSRLNEINPIKSNEYDDNHIKLKPSNSFSYNKIKQVLILTFVLQFILTSYLHRLHNSRISTLQTFWIDAREGTSIKQL